MKPLNILITGTTKGIGKSISNRLSQAGHNIIPLNRSTLDLSDVEQVKNYIMPECDVLINNAAVDNRDLLEDADYEKIIETINVNLISPMILCAQFSKANKNGTIINISSSCIKTNRTNSIVYSVSKFGLHKLTDLMMQYNYGKPTRVVEIIPGKTNTTMSDKSDLMIEPNEVAETVEIALKNQNINQIFVKSL